LEEHPDIADTVEHAIRVHYGLLDDDEKDTGKEAVKKDETAAEKS
jgi:recombination protein RecA